MSKYTSQFLDSPTAARLRVFTRNAGKNAKGIVQINHGMAEHAARYERFAETLAAAGYHTICHDHRGHGETTAPDAPLGQFARNDGWRLVLNDVAFLIEHARNTFPDLPVCLFGHSMGATVTASFILHHPKKADAAAVWNGSMTGFLPNLLKFLLKIERMLKGSDVPSGWADGLTFKAWNKEFKPVRTEFDWLSRDEAEVDKYVADPLCGFPVNVGLWLDLLEALDGLADETRINTLENTMPINLLGGASDPCSTHGKAVTQFGDRLEKAGLNDVTRTILPDTRHESLNEINRDETMTNFIAWLDGRFGR
ncbi:MAG: alpha/beta hydrolase [Pseudomonadota bacterium]